MGLEIIGLSSVRTDCRGFHLLAVEIVLHWSVRPRIDYFEVVLKLLKVLKVESLRH